MLFFYILPFQLKFANLSKIGYFSALLFKKKLNFILFLNKFLYNYFLFIFDTDI